MKFLLLPNIPRGSSQGELFLLLVTFLKIECQVDSTGWSTGKLKMEAHRTDATELVLLLFVKFLNIVMENVLQLRSSWNYLFQFFPHLGFYTQLHTNGSNIAGIPRLFFSK